MQSLHLWGSLRWSSAPAEQPELWENSTANTKSAAVAEQGSLSITRQTLLAGHTHFVTFLAPFPTPLGQLSE